MYYDDAGWKGGQEGVPGTATPSRGRHTCTASYCTEHYITNPFAVEVLLVDERNSGETRCEIASA